MTVEHNPAAGGIIEDWKTRYPETEIVFEGEPSLLDGYSWLFPVVTDLLSNCLEERAKSVRIKLERGRLTAEDDVVHENPQEILLNLNSNKPKTTKNDRPSGAGIYNLRKILDWHDGKLEYHAEGGKIIAVATWVE